MTDSTSGGGRLILQAAPDTKDPNKIRDWMNINKGILEKKVITGLKQDVVTKGFGIAEAQVIGASGLTQNGLVTVLDGIFGVDTNTYATYASGPWTPLDNSPAALTITVSEAYWIKIGFFLIVGMALTYPTTSDTNNASIKGLPFNIASGDVGAFARAFFTKGFTAQGNAGTKTFAFYTDSGAGTNLRNVDLSGKIVQGIFFCEVG